MTQENVVKRVPVWAQLIILYVAYYLMLGFWERTIDAIVRPLNLSEEWSYIVGDVIIFSTVGVGLLLIYQFLSGRSPKVMLQGARVPQFLLGSVVGLGIISGIVLLLYLKGDLSFTSIRFTPLIAGNMVFFLFVSWMEEVFTRGVILHVLKDYSVALAVILSAALFGFMHLGNSAQTLLSIPNTVLVGIMLGLATIQTKSMRFALGFHFAWNTALATVFGMIVSGTVFKEAIFPTKVLPSAESGYNYGVEGGYVVTVIMGLIIMVQLILFWRNKNEKISRI